MFVVLILKATQYPLTGSKFNMHSIPWARDIVVLSVPFCFPISPFSHVTFMTG